MTIADEDVEVTIRLSPAAYHLACEIVSETDPDMRRRYGLYEDMSVGEFLAKLLERKLR